MVSAFAKLQAYSDQTYDASALILKNGKSRYFVQRVATWLHEPLPYRAALAMSNQSLNFTLISC